LERIYQPFSFLNQSIEKFLEIHSTKKTVHIADSFVTMNVNLIVEKIIERKENLSVKNGNLEYRQD
jgi:hypothetical protein